MDRAAREEAVDWFAQRMKLKMRLPRNEAKGGWRDESFRALWRRILEESSELDAEIRDEPHGGAVNYDAVIDECCDVAFFAMAVADLARQLKG